jgi:hypothetical protein
LCKKKKEKGWSDDQVKEYRQFLDKETDQGSKDMKQTFTKELGLGISLYFKFLRALTFMFIIFSVISIPTYSICSEYGKTTQIELSSFGPGNIGESSENCRTFRDINFMDVDEVITCPYGEIIGFTEVGFIDTNCAVLKSKGINWTKVRNIFRSDA